MKTRYFIFSLTAVLSVLICSWPRGQLVLQAEAQTLQLAGVTPGSGTSAATSFSVLGVTGGAAASTTSNGNAGSSVSIVAGNGSTAGITSGNAGAPGTIALTAGNAGNFTSGTTAAGGNVTLTAGNGASTSAGTNGNGGNISLVPGAVGTGGSGGTNGAIVFGLLGTASNPSVQFSGQAANTGLFGGTTSICWSATGTNTACFVNSGLELASGQALSMSNGSGTATPDVALARMGPNVIETSTSASSPNNSGYIKLGQGTCLVTSTITLSGQTNICQFSLPASGITWGWICHIGYTVSSGMNPTFTLGMNPSQTPTRVSGFATIYSTNSGTSTGFGMSTTSGGNTNILTSPVIAATGTYQAITSGVLQASAMAGTFTITGTLGGTSPTGNIAMGTMCELF
jgi:hypothetical protein